MYKQYNQVSEANIVVLIAAPSTNEFINIPQLQN